MTSILRHTVDGCEILHELVTIGIKLCKEWDYIGINHLPTGDFFQGFWALYPSSSSFLSRSDKVLDSQALNKLRRDLGTTRQ